MSQELVDAVIDSVIPKQQIPEGTINNNALMKAYLKTGSVAKAAKVMNCSYHHAWKLLHVDNGRAALSAIMDACGVNDQELLTTLVEGLQATKTTMGGKKEADHATRHKFLETDLRLKGHLKGGNIEVDASGTDNKVMIVLNSPGKTDGQAKSS